MKSILSIILRIDLHQPGSCRADIRQAGSGNIGAANVARVAGPLPGILTLLLDAGKGALAVWLLVVKGNYQSVEKVFLFACVVYIAYIISGVLVQPDWKEAAIYSVRPVLMLDRGYIYMLIGMVGAYRGMQVRESARELGRLTTVAVVQSIFMVILADALFAILFVKIDF